jgi:predicted nicotinamide N-methyase
VLDHAVHLAVPGEHKLEPEPKAVQRRVPRAEEPHAGEAHREAPGLVVVLDRLDADVVTEPLRLLVGIRVAAHVDEQRGVVDDGPLLLVQADSLGQPQRDQALAQHVLHRLSEAEVDAERQRGHELGQPYVRAIRLADERLFHVPLNTIGQRLQSGTVSDELVSVSIDLPSGELRVLQPEESAELPDDGPVEWAPLAPYWSVLWRSGVELAHELDAVELRGLRVVELGCGLAIPSIAAARAGAEVLATDSDAEALELVERNARQNGVRVETAMVDWTRPEELVGRGPFDLVLAADVLYERPSVAPLLSLLPQLAPEAWLADPGRPAAAAFLDEADRRGWGVETRVRDVVRIHRLQPG